MKHRRWRYEARFIQKSLTASVRLFCGAPDRIRTCDLQNRNLLLYPAELPELSGFRRKNMELKLSFCQSSFESLCELIGAGGVFETAFCALNAFDDVGCFHAYNELSDTLGVAVASADELNGINHTVCDLYVDLTSAGSLSFEFNVLCHGFHSFILYKIRREDRRSFVFAKIGQYSRHYVLYHKFEKKIAVFYKKIIFVNFKQK